MKTDGTLPEKTAFKADRHEGRRPVGQGISRMQRFAAIGQKRRVPFRTAVHGLF
ncbi:hypothetical protein [Bacteroides sp. KG122]|uniref:hypothetical protein n=1 Tax=Bacteroides sp. KG122 TaxID=3397827 RepID=UPI003D98777D